MMTFSKNFPLKLTLDLGTDVQRSSEVKKVLRVKPWDFLKQKRKWWKDKKV